MEKHKKNQKQPKRKIWNVILITIGGVIGLLLVSYAIFLTVFDAWAMFGQPFWFEDGALLFGEKNCCEGEERDCGPFPNYSVCGCNTPWYGPDGKKVIIDYKPIIYLYPNSETDVEVRLGNPEKLTTTYPKYDNGWSVKAFPNGDLIDKKTGNKLYALYWEGETNYDYINFNKGFVVPGEEVTSFLEEKLGILGLNYKEKEEFITYWLSKLEKNKYNYVYFPTADEIEREMPIKLSVKPETIVRVRMIFKGLDKPIKIKEQKLEEAPKRQGFTMVEWGGSEL